MNLISKMIEDLERHFLPPTPPVMILKEDEVLPDSKPCITLRAKAYYLGRMEMEELRFSTGVPEKNDYISMFYGASVYKVDEPRHYSVRYV